MARDKDSIGLTAATQAALSDLERLDWFPEGQDIARFCMAYAIREKVPEGVTLGPETRWAAGNFDKTGEIRALLGALYPTCETPVRLMEHLVNEGLLMVNARAAGGDVSPTDLMT